MSKVTKRREPTAPTTRSKWAKAFAEARADAGTWRMVNWPLSRVTATQVASDIRNAHKPKRKSRVMTGIEKGEKWDAAWDEIDGEFFVFIRYPV